MYPSKPDRQTGLLWFLFSATATISAFTLPVHLWALMNLFDMNRGNFFMKSYFFVVIAAGLYHSFYRIKTIIFDIGFPRAAKITAFLLAFLFITLIIGAALIIF